MTRGLVFKSFFLALIMLSMVLTSGCATMKRWVGMGDEESKQAKVEEKKPFMVDGEVPVRFSEVNNLPSASARQYKKMTRQRMEEESQLHAQAGSMWVMEGQGAYLFTQNKSRREGDMLNVKVEGAAQKQIETKRGELKIAETHEENLRSLEGSTQVYNPGNTRGAIS